MSESRNTEQPRPEQPIERPTWRFSGRRGTPVHLRDQAPATLPREIQDAIVQMARERSGEKPAAGDARPTNARTSRPSMGLGPQPAPTQDTAQAPPVAGAPMPVERRSPRPEAAAPSTPTIIGTATAPSTEQPVGDDEPRVDASTEQSSPEPAAVEAAPEPAAVEPAAATPTAAKPKRASKSRAKARAKARAKRAKERAKQERSAAILAGDQEVQVTDPTELAVEPPLAELAPPTADALVEAAPSATSEHPTASDDAPAAPATTPVASDLADFLEDSLVWAPVPAEPDAEQVREVSALLAAPSGGREHASQGAWELGRLPILLHPPIDIPAPRPVAEPAPAVLDIPAASDPIVVGEVAASTPEQQPDAPPEPVEAPAAAQLEPAVLRPIDWAPLPAHLEPAPIQLDDEGPADVPAAIERLTSALPTRGPGHASHARASAGDQGDDEPRRAPALRAADARHHVGRRRTDLDEVIRSLGSLTRH